MIIYKAIGGAVDQLVEIKSEGIENPKYYFSTILSYIEKVVKAILVDASSGKLNSNSVVIGANLMVFHRSTSKLELKYFGTVMAGREKISLNVDQNSPKPGAPAACARERIIYINDTHSEKYREFFDLDKDYRSIISIPIRNPKDGVTAVVNIDSNIPEHFGSDEYIRTRIIPKLDPFIGLISLEKESF